LTIVERLTRFTIIIKLENTTKEAVRSTIIKALSGYKVQSIISDNGTEFAGLAEVGRVLCCKVYRCHPYASREKGGNERNNGIIRRFCPK
jgi:IS30 family transposase